MICGVDRSDSRPRQLFRLGRQEAGEPQATARPIGPRAGRGLARPNDRTNQRDKGGRNLSLAPFASIIALIEARLWLERLSMITTSPGRRVGIRTRAT